MPGPRRQGLARLQAVRSGAARRRGQDTARASATGLAEGLPLRPGYAVFSGASGVAAPAEAEAGFLADLGAAGPAQGPVRHTADILGHTVEAAFLPTSPWPPWRSTPAACRRRW
ncbi:hypothetical protein ACFQY5_07650 [Paeniroseomonas aquatica]|uniref:hypothetical protein n=1 Tax=Paeniroseomonas aquatica TaxID=373043 RepID=UPI003611A3A4